jgi:hypothetical protein
MTTFSHEELEGMKVDELKDILRQRGQRLGGTKAELIERVEVNELAEQRADGVTRRLLVFGESK